jgi:hypothetical protein
LLGRTPSFRRFVVSKLKWKSLQTEASAHNINFWEVRCFDENKIRSKYCNLVAAAATAAL